MESPSSRFLERYALPLAVVPFYLEGLWRWPVWDAERWTAVASGGSLQNLYSLVARDKHPPLFFLVEWLLFRLHPTEVVERVVPALAAVASVALLQRVGTRHFGRLVGWYAALLLALSPYLLAYAATARSGTVTTLAGVLVLGFGLDLVTGDRPRRSAFGLAAIATIGLYVHYDLLLALVGVGLGGMAAVALDERPGRLTRLGWGAGALLMAGLAFLPWVLGPMAKQDIGEVPVLRSWAVLRYLWWPVGTRYVPFGGTILVLLAIAGLWRLLRKNPWGGMMGGWALGALLGPYLWSTNPATLGKFYLYAPLQGFFLMLAGVALAGVTKRLGRWVPRSPFLVSALCILGGIRPLYDVIRTDASLVSIATSTPGVYDARLDVLAFRTARTQRPAMLIREKAAEDWLFYAPERGAAPLPAGVMPRDIWLPVERTDEPARLAELRKKVGDGCLMTEAFDALLWIPKAEDCTALLERVRELGESLEYGPFLLEVAAQAAERKDWETAEKYAALASEHSPVSARPEILWGKVLNAQQKYGRTLEMVDLGMEKAFRYHHPEEAVQLSILRVEAADRSHDPEESAKAQDLVHCLQKDLPIPLDGYCWGGLGWLL